LASKPFALFGRVAAKSIDVRIEPRGPRVGISSGSKCASQAVSVGCSTAANELPDDFKQRRGGRPSQICPRIEARTDERCGFTPVRTGSIRPKSPNSEQPCQINQVTVAGIRTEFTLPRPSRVIPEDRECVPLRIRDPRDHICSSFASIEIPAALVKCVYRSGGVVCDRKHRRDARRVYGGIFRSLLGRGPDELRNRLRQRRVCSSLQSGPRLALEIDRATIG
jgi:hypothetical protein